MANGVPQRIASTSRGFSEQGLELGEHLLDRVQIRAVRRQVEDAGADGSDGLAHAGDFVRGA